MDKAQVKTTRILLILSILALPFLMNISAGAEYPAELEVNITGVYNGTELIAVNDNVSHVNSTLKQITVEFSVNNASTITLGLDPINGKEINDSLLYAISFNQPALEWGTTGPLTISQNTVYNTTEKKIGNSSVSFDGIDDDIYTANAPASIGNFTLNEWIYLGGGTSQVLLFDWAQPTIKLLYDYAGGLELNIDTDVTDCSLFDFQTATIQNFTWTMVSVVYNGTECATYINGVLDGHEATTGNITTAVDKGLHWGETWNGLGDFYGNIDEFAFWNRSLSIIELMGLYTNLTNASNIVKGLFGDEVGSNPSTTKSGYISNITGSRPFQIINGSNPVNITVASAGKYNYTFWVNATGDYGNYEFFADVHLINGSLLNTSYKFNVSIIPAPPPNNAPIATWIFPNDNDQIEVGTNNTLNFSYSDADLDAFISGKIYVNGTINMTLSVLENISEWNASEGFYNLTLSFYDGADWGENTSIVFDLLYPDTTNPTIDTLQNYPSNHSLYTSSYQFNATINDETALDTVIISFNGTNITLGNGGGIYSYNTTLTPGFYDYYWFANDTSGNVNITKPINYVVNQSIGNVSVYINNSRANLTMNYSQTVNLSGILNQGVGNILLYNNGTLINNGTSPIWNNTQFTKLGIYNITAIFKDNSNYTYSSETFWLNVTNTTQEAAPPVVSVADPRLSCEIDKSCCSNPTYDLDTLCWINISWNECGDYGYANGTYCPEAHYNYDAGAETYKEIHQHHNWAADFSFPNPDDLGQTKGGPYRVNWRGKAIFWGPFTGGGNLADHYCNSWKCMSNNQVASPFKAEIESEWWTWNTSLLGWNAMECTDVDNCDVSENDALWLHMLNMEANNISVVDESQFGCNNCLVIEWNETFSANSYDPQSTESFYFAIHPKPNNWTGVGDSTEINVSWDAIQVVTTQGISGENITTGTVADARIPATITRDSELNIYLTNNTDVVVDKFNATKNGTINGFHIDRYNSTHYKLWGE